jgi:hypothetical protein
MTAQDALRFAIEVATRNTFWSEHTDPGGDFGGPKSCEYRCGHVIARVLREKLREIDERHDD